MASQACCSSVSVAGAVRAVAEFLNLYSRWRGQNRFVTLVMTFDLLREHPAVRAAGVEIAPLNATRAWVESGAALSNATLEQTVAETGDAELASVVGGGRKVPTGMSQYS